jgi:mevalonate kinase
VAIGKWFQSMNLVAEIEVYEFSRILENLFHGESSGVDIAVALSGEGLRFLREGKRTPVQMNWSPWWYVSYSGKRGVTLECVNKVKALLIKDPAFGNQIDDDMKKSVQMAEEALALNPSEGLLLLKKSMDLGRTCFERWDLSVDSHLNWLTEQGALAVKPTGSGDGGYILSLWASEPPFEVQKSLISCL